MKRKLLRFFVLGLACSMLGGVSSAYAADLDQAAFDKAMETYLSKDANIEKVGNSLQAHFMKKRAEQEKAQQQDEAKAIEDQFKNPVKIDIGGAPVKGPANAKVTIIEFSDFQCPFCKRGMDTMDEVLKAYPKDVKVAFKHLPLPFHPEAKPAARATIAAQRQGKFWEMHDLLFNNQQSLSAEYYPKAAQQLGLDMAKFNKDFADPAVEKIVDADMELANSHGIRGTPGFFVNGVQVRGAQPFPVFKEIIDRWLKEGDKK